MTDKPRSQDEMLARIERIVEKIERTLYGEPNVSTGLLARIEEIETEARRLSTICDGLEDDRERRQAQLERFRRFVWPVIILFIGGAITSIFNFVSNFLQTLAGG